MTEEEHHEEEEEIPPPTTITQEEQHHQRRRSVAWLCLLTGLLVVVAAIGVGAAVAARRTAPDSSSSGGADSSSSSSSSSFSGEKEEEDTLSPATTQPPVVSSSSKKKKKNIILIIADDLGIRDLGCYNDPHDDAATGNDRFYETPHLDCFASESVLFENAYSAHATCAQSRAGLFTGMFPSRLGVVDFTRLIHTGFRNAWRCLRRADGWGKGEQMVPLEAVTMPEAFLKHGYKTALIGKWHSGTAERGLPHEHGFEITIGNKTGLVTHFSPYLCSPSNNKCRQPPSNLSLQVPDGTMMADHLTMEAVSLLQNEFTGNDKKTNNDPFFLVLSHYAVHTPIESEEETARHFRGKRSLLNQSALDFYLQVDGLIERQTQDHPIYAGLLKSLDDSVGTLLQSVRDLGLENDTIVVFTSDNGGKSSDWNGEKARQQALTSNQPFKSAKGYIGDGGIRVPLIIRAPGLQEEVVPPHRRTLFQSHGVDYFPTLLELAGLPLQPRDHVDGVSLVPAIRGQTAKRGKPMFWQDPAECFVSSSTNTSSQQMIKKCTETSYAVISDQWKLLKRVYSKESDDDNATLELYNIETDPGERTNLVRNESFAPELKEMEQTLQNWQRTWFETPYFERLRALYNNCT